jgi:nitrogen fixation protein NifU and related proteins
VYSVQVLDHFQHPRNSGDLAAADVSVTVENPACGDIMQLALRITDSRITEVRFKTRGCATSIACGSMLTELIHSKTIADASRLERQQLVNALGGLTNETMHGSHLAMDALQTALKQASKL